MVWSSEWRINMKIKVRITNNGPIGGFTAEIEKNGKWTIVNKWIGGGVVSFDSRSAALKALEIEAKAISRGI